MRAEDRSVPPSGRRRTSAAQRAEMADRYRAGESMRVLAAAFGLSVNTIRSTLLDSGVELRPPGRQRKEGSS